MGTLDEVIEAIEVCRDSYVAGKIIKSDALHYLKKYRDLKSTMDWHTQMEEIRNSIENVPLTWDELRKMEGKPVWIELLDYDVWEDPSHRVDSDWWIIGEVRKNDIIAACYLDEMELCEEDLGRTWQAYRKENV